MGEAIYASRTEWLAARNNGLGASDAAAVLGISPWKSNVNLWREKRGLEVPADISENKAVEYGTRAEAPLRELYALDHPEYRVDYTPFKVYADDKHPQLRATLDGELTEVSNGRRGVLEIKTTEISSATQWSKWDSCIPDYYYSQICHQLMVTGWDFAVLKAQIKYFKGISTREYIFERADLEDDIGYLLGKELEFWECVRARKEPPRILPSI